MPTPRLRVVPHVLTFSRLPLGVAFLLFFDAASAARLAAAAVLLAAAAASDALDGHLARHMGAVTALGKWADPLTDALFFLFVYLSFHLAGLMPAFLVALFLTREAVQYAVIRPLTARRGGDPGARPAGKIKTGTQIAAAAMVLILCGLSAAGILSRATTATVCAVVLATAVAVSLVSLYWYVRPLVEKRR